MALKHSCRRELAQFVSHHVFSDKHLVKHFAVMDKERKADELRHYRTSSRPCLYWLARAGGILFVDFYKNLLVNVWSFF